MNPYFTENFSLLFDTYVKERLTKENSIKHYRAFLSDAANYLRKSPELISGNEWNRFFLYLHKEKKNSKETLIYKRRILGAILSFIDSRGQEFHLTGSYVGQLSSVYNVELAVDVEDRNVADLNAANQLIDYLEKSHYDDLILLATTLALQYAMSLRDIASLKEENLIRDDYNCYICIPQENDYDRSIALSDDTIKLIESIISKKPKSAAPGLFISNRKTPLSARSLEHRLTQAVSAAGLTGISFLKLRNLSIAYLMANGVSQEDIQILTGASVTWLFRYRPHIQNLTVAGKQNCILEKESL